jgi:hypothetical protein
MSELKELIKKSFDLWVKMRWLKTIDKEVKKRRKYFFKYKRQEYVVNKLVEEYNNLYADFKIKSEDTE